MTKKIFAVALGLAAFASLSACAKPTPGVTVWSGTTSQNRPAVCWSHEPTVAQSVTDCVTRIQTELESGKNVSLAQVPVTPGNTVGIDVDESVAATGWTVFIAGQPVVAEPIKTTYFRFTFPNTQIPADGYPIVVQVAGAGAGTTRGLWVYSLTASGQA